MPAPANSGLKMVGNPRWLALLAIGLGGWAAGTGLHRWLDAESSPPPTAGVVRAAAETKPDPAEVAATRAALDEVANLKSTDTLDDLLALEDRQLYGRLALWLLDASTADLARFWTAYQAKRQPEKRVADLLFARWTRLDPEDALPAAGPEHQAKAWWAWAVNDPATAVARVAAMDPQAMDSVLRAIGQFHPEMLARVMAEHPESFTDNPIETVAEGLFRDDPAAAMKFLRQRWHFDTQLLREWARDDPKAAFAWVRQQMGDFQNTQLNILIETLERENPAALRELANEQPPGKLRHQMDAAVFRNLLTTDPAAALAQARATESPRLAAERLTAAARRMVGDDPEQAFGLFSKLLEKCPTAFRHYTLTAYPDGSSGNSGALEGVLDMTGALLDNDPRRAMTVAETAGGENSWKSSEGSAAVLAQQWAERDLKGFCGWLDEQPPGPAQDNGTRIAVDQLASQNAFQEAAQRAVTVADESQRNSLVSAVAQSWARQDRAAAAAWLDQLELPDQVRQKTIDLEAMEDSL